MDGILREGLCIINELPISTILYIDGIVRERKEERHFQFVGEGGSGKVYRYKNYAIKVYNDDVRNNQDPTFPYDGYFLTLLGKSPYYPTVYYYVNKEYMVTEFIEGTSIYNSTADEFVSYISKLKEAVHFAYERGLIACDLSDMNIIISKNKIPVIVDVGSFWYINKDEELNELTREFFTRYTQTLISSIANKIDEA